jgi:hypothetical protein
MSKTNFKRDCYFLSYYFLDVGRPALLASMPRIRRRQLKSRAISKAKRAAFRERKVAHQYSHPHQKIDLDDRTNITITEQSTGATIVQKIGPTCHSFAEGQRQSAKDAMNLKTALFHIIKQFPESSDVDGDQVCHLGISTYGQKVEWSMDHKQSRPASDEMLAWISSYFNAYIRPLQSINNRAAILPLLATDFKNDLEGRANVFKSLTKKMSVENFHLLHRWWTRATIILDARTEFQSDERYLEPSILLNFGTKILFEIDGSKVCLHPGDVLLYRASLPHRFRTVEGSLEGDMPDRFALCLRTRKVVTGSEPSKSIKWEND